MQTSQGAYGHVAYVESVNDDGSVKVSEMNYNGTWCRFITYNLSWPSWFIQLHFII